ncbi:MAG: hypothetical protein N3C12_03110 [Candidatus Binatia bacterium]|nr:hypothetical protein [Candidatus Binatia bacterium]
MAVLCAVTAGCAILPRSGPKLEAKEGASGVAQSVELGAADAGGQIAELESRLREREAELLAVRAELEALRRQQGTVLVKPNLTPRGGDEAGRPEETTSGTQAESELAQALARERAERLALMEELERLRQEVSSPFGENYVAERDYLALKQELIELRRSLQEQEQQRNLTAKISGSAEAEDRKGPSEPHPPTEGEHIRITAETQQELAESRRRIAELEAALQSAKKEGDQAAALATENESLRSQLAEERRRAEALEAKLKVAARVTDLIFRMQTQQRGGGGGPPSP